MKNRFIPMLLALLAMAFVCPPPASAEEGLSYPLREKHPGLAYVETGDLAAALDKNIVIDSRNESEFEVIHIKGAHNILVGKMQEKDLLALRGKTDANPIVFYCNGITCAKSYKAAEKATEWGFANVQVYDAGIFHWAKQQPALTLFFGEPLSSETVASSLIGKEDFEAVCLSTADFLAKANGGGYEIFDIRDPNERSEKPIKLAKMKTMPFDTMVKLMKEKSKAVPRSGLLILDNVGKQVDWLQYYLRKEGISDYYFLKGGVNQWIADGYAPDGSK